MRTQPQLKFDEVRATQVAARFLAAEGGGINIMKLVKLMYYADRAALVRWGHPLTYDSYYSLPSGPILSFTLNLLNGDMEGDYWSRFVSARHDHEVRLVDYPGFDALSVAERDLIDEIYKQLGDKDQFQLVKLSHLLPEWEDPQGSSRRIGYRAILRSEGYSEKEIDEMFADLGARVAMAQLAGQQA